MIRVLQYGLGPIGAEVLRLLAMRPGLALVGAVDIDPQKAGRTVAEVTGIAAPGGVRVQDRLLPQSPADVPQVAIHCTASRLSQVYQQLAELIRQGINVVSSAEELSYPWLHHAEAAANLDALAREHGVRVLGTGIDPGFVLDEMVLALASVCGRITRVRARRVLDAARRRRSLQLKIGAGMSEADFHRAVALQAIGHVGLQESVAYVAAGLGWKLNRIEVDLAPKISEQDVATAHVSVRKGQVAGIQMAGRGLQGNREAITLELVMYLGAGEACDEVQFTGEPDLTLSVPGGIPGDVATAAKLLNSIPRVLSGPPGLFRPPAMDIPQ